MTTTPMLAELTDRVAICRMYRMSLQANALHYDDKDREFANLMRAASCEAGRLAEEAAEVAMFLWAAEECEP